MSKSRWSIVVAVALCVGLAGPAAAVDEADGRAMRGVIDGQIAALRADNADLAYSFAAPLIQRMFPNGSAFMEMVRQGYPPVYRARRYEFGAARDTEAGPEQSVRIDDADGIGWDAVYTFEKQQDGTWKISGCRLVRAPDQSV